MKLSEAILKGCEIAPKQRFSDYVAEGKNGKLSACVLGAAALAINPNARTPEEVAEALHSAFPYIEAVLYPVTDMNDRDQRSREDIARVLAERGW